MMAGVKRRKLSYEHCISIRGKWCWTYMYSKKRVKSSSRQSAPGPNEPSLTHGPLPAMLMATSAVG